jgi:hypothetical protein
MFSCVWLAVVGGGVAYCFASWLLASANSKMSLVRKKLSACVGAAECAPLLEESTTILRDVVEYLRVRVYVFMPLVCVVFSRPIFMTPASHPSHPPPPPPTPPSSPPPPRPRKSSTRSCISPLASSTSSSSGCSSALLLFSCFKFAVSPALHTSTAKDKASNPHCAPQPSWFSECHCSFLSSLSWLWFAFSFAQGTLSRHFLQQTPLPTISLLRYHAVLAFRCPPTVFQAF